MPQSDALVSPSAHLREGENGGAGAGHAVAAAPGYSLPAVLGPHGREERERQSSRRRVALNTAVQ